LKIKAGSVLFGGAVERTAKALGFPTPHFTAAQRNLPVVQRTALAGTMLGVILGCTLGLINLLFIDTRRTQELKIMAAEASHLPYEIEASNSKRPDATVITIRGPDRRGLLADIASTFRDQEISMIEVDAHNRAAVDMDRSSTDNNYVTMIEDVFVVQNQNQQLSEEQLQKVALTLQTATARPQQQPVSSESNTRETPDNAAGISL
jgi:predicted amino acid-binding ACT domain protein